MAAIEKLEANFELALRQAEQELDRKLKLERAQFERRLSELKEAQLGQIKQLRQQLEASFSPFPQPDGQVSMGQLEEMLHRLKAEIVDELDRRDVGHTRPDVRLSRASRTAEPAKKSPEIVLDEQDLEEGFEFPKPKASKPAEDVVTDGDDKPEKIQEELFDMIRELAQEKRKQELKIPTAVEAKQSLGSKLFKRS